MERSWGELPLGAIDATRVEMWGVAQLEAGKSIRTVTGYMDSLSKLFQYQARTHKYLDNPTVHARKAIAQNVAGTANFRAMNDENCNP